MRAKDRGGAWITSESMTHAEAAAVVATAEAIEGWAASRLFGNLLVDAPSPARQFVARAKLAQPTLDLNPWR